MLTSDSVLPDPSQTPARNADNIATDVSPSFLLSPCKPPHGTDAPGLMAFSLYDNRPADV